MKLSVLLVGISATAVVLWLFAFLDEVQARPALRAPIAAVQYPFPETPPAPPVVVRSLDAG